MDAETKANIEGQVARQTLERDAYTPALTAAQDALAAAQAEVTPLQAELDACEARAAELKALIGEKQPAVSSASYDLKALQQNATALDDSIRGCQLVLDADAAK